MPLREMARMIAASMNQSHYAAVHIRRGDKAQDRRWWPHLDEDTRPPR